VVSKRLHCHACKRDLTTDEFLSSCDRYDASLDVVRFQCKGCGDSVDVRLANGAIGIGYVYAAGAPQFAEMDRVEVQGLHVSSDEGVRVVRLDGGRWRITPAQTPRIR
jgi:hypothetical protein